MEEWLKIPGYDYEMSNHGRCRSLTRTVVQVHDSRGGKSTRTYKGKILLPGKEPRPNNYRGNENGIIYYHSYRLSRGGKVFKILAHQQVARLFIENPEDKEFVGHLDNNPENNRADNLEWCTRSENEQHKYSSGYSQKERNKI